MKVSCNSEAAICFIVYQEESTNSCALSQYCTTTTYQQISDLSTSTWSLYDAPSALLIENSATP